MRVRAQRVIDVSNVNPADLATLKASHAAAIICKATAGLGFRDGVCPAARAAARKLGVPFGGYLFLHPSLVGKAQALAYLRYAQPRPDDIEPSIDSEVTDGHTMSDVARVVDECARTLEARGYRPLLYGSTSWLLSLYAERPGLRRLRVWQAEYPASLPRTVPARLKRRARLGRGITVALWQYTSRWQIRGRGFDGSYLLAPLDTIRIPKA